MGCKSAIYAVNTSTVTIPEGGTYQPNTIIRRFGQCCQMANNAMELNGQGYYDVAVTATVLGTAVGNVTMAVYQDGIAVPGQDDDYGIPVLRFCYFQFHVLLRFFGSLNRRLSIWLASPLDNPAVSKPLHFF